MNLRKILKGIYRIHSISVQSIDVNPNHPAFGSCEIEFHRVKWGLFGGKYKNNSYVRRHINRYTSVFRYKCHSVPFLYSTQNWSVQFYPDTKVHMYNPNIIYLAYLIYIIFLLLRH